MSGAVDGGDWLHRNVEYCSLLYSTAHVVAVVVLVLVLVLVLTLTHPYSAVRGHRTGSDNSGVGDYLRRKTNKKQKIIHTITETNCIPETNKTVRSAYVRMRYTSYAKRVAAEIVTEETA